MKAIAIDGGGSKTRVLCQESSEDITEATFAMSNVYQAGQEGLEHLTDEILRTFEITNPEDYKIIAGLAGAGNLQNKALASKTLINRGFSVEDVEVMSDAELLLRALGNNGIVLISGTGSICMGMREGRLARAGGRGYLIGDEGSGFYLGKRVLNAAFLDHDKMGPPTQLTQQVKDHFQTSNIESLIPLFYGAEVAEAKKEIASLATLAFESAALGDEVGTALMQESVDALAAHILSVYEQLPSKADQVGLHGGVFKHPLAEDILIQPIISHPKLSSCELDFVTLGVGANDLDPLKAALDHSGKGTE